jgi:hypothetical protein
LHLVAIRFAADCLVLAEACGWALLMFDEGSVLEVHGRVADSGHIYLQQKVAGPEDQCNFHSATLVALVVEAEE